MGRNKNGFTLIEVMVSVIIISTVIMALLVMRGNSSHMFMNFSNKLELNQYLSFLTSNTKPNGDTNTTTIENILSDFNINNNLRKKLKDIKVKIIYQELNQIDLSKNSDKNSENNNSDTIFEINKMILKTDKTSTSLLRLNTQ